MAQARLRQSGRRGPARLAASAAALVLALVTTPAYGDPLPPQIHTVAGSGTCAGAVTWGGPCDGVAATSVPINGARAVAALPGGGFLYVDEADEVVRQVSPSGTVTTVAGNGSTADAPDGTLAVDSGLNDPVAVTPMTDGGFLVTEFGGSIVRTVSAATPATATITTIAGNGTPGSNGTSGPATSVELNHPTDAEVTSGGQVLIADAYNNAVRLLSSAGPGATMSTIIGGGSCSDATNTCDGLPASQVAVIHPVSVAPIAGGSGGYLIAEYDESAVRRVSAVGPQGTFTTVAGDPTTAGFSGDGGPATAALLNHPEQVTATPDGGFLIADTGNERIRSVSAEGTITTVAGNGLATYAGDGGAATAASLFAPSGAAPQPDGGFLIADSDNNAIRAVTVPPTTTIAVTPATPSGQNGWYVAPVHVTVTAVGATQTVCTADPATPPTVYDLIPDSCPYAGAGADIGADGPHTVYAASIDAAGDKEIPVSLALKIDATPPTVTCAAKPPSFPAGTRGVITATVSDQGSGPAAASVSVPAQTSHVGSRTATVTSFDNAGNKMTLECPYKVLALALRPLPALDWRFGVHRSLGTSSAGTGTQAPAERPMAYVTVERLVVTKVPVKSVTTLLCRGRGCGFASIECPSRRCARRARGTIDLTRALAGRRLTAGITLIIQVARRNTIGRVWIFTARGAQQPRHRVTCLAPGSKSPGKGC